MNFIITKQKIDNINIFNIIDKQTNLNSILVKKNNLYFNLYILNYLTVNLGKNNLFLSLILNNKFKSFYILFIKLIKNLLETNTIYTKELYIEGIGYFFKKDPIKKQILILNIGKTHNIKIKLPKYINFKIINNGTYLILTGTNKELINLIASKIKSIKPPEIYKGKGIYFSYEKINKKLINKSKKS
uniref:50S ribosomal protein L6 n=1 Tax=Nephromyces sp. ex Molgula occidentalis TaxID=2544991 RepID=A0A5C1H8Z7_9APIC|nr:50S ribosomal protein L6 [Nephromyces sp. ex Molgula occidentalis]